MPKTQTNSPIANPLSDARKLTRHTAATAAELRSFLRELQGRSPKEMLGEVANSDLGRSTITASIGAAALILVLTIIPFTWSKMTTSNEQPLSGAPTAAQPAVHSTEITAPDTAPTDLTPSPEAIEKLGVGGQRSAPTTVNPLENTNGDLLKDLE